MSNNRESLRTIISKLSKDKNKKTIGYAVSDYEKVLDALKSAKIIVQKGESKTVLKSSWGTKTINYTVLVDGFITPNSSIKIDDISKPLVGNHVINETKQVRCSLKSYMSFPLQYTEGSDTENTVVEHKIFQDNSGIVKGMDITANVKMPTKLLYDDSLANHQGNFKIGFCADFETVVTNYFNHFYAIEGKNNTWTINNIKKIAEGYNLFVEVMKPILGEAGNSKVLHGMVVADTCMPQKQNGTPILSLYMPTPLFLLDDFKEFGGLQVKDNSKKIFQVNEGEVLFPFRDKKYDHKRGEINDYSPQSLKSYRTGKLALYTLENDNKEYVSYVRFYFDISSKEYINELVFKKQMPNTEHFQKELFRGVKTEHDDIYRQEIITYALDGIVNFSCSPNDSPYYMDGQVDWERLERKGRSGVTKYKDDWISVSREMNINTRFMLAIHCWETGWGTEEGRDGYAWRVCNNPGGLLCSDSRIAYDDYAPRSKFGGIQAAKDKEGTGHGRYWKFRSKADGIRAKAYLLINSPNYGLKRRNYKNVEHFFAGLQLGHKYFQHESENPIAESTWSESGKIAYCPTPQYGKKILNLYLKSL